MERREDKFVWEIAVVTAEERVKTVLLDADTGAVIDLEEKQAQERTRERPRGTVGEPRP